MLWVPFLIHTYTHALDTGILEFNSCSDHELDLFLVDMLTQLLYCTSTEPTGPVPPASWGS